MIHSINKLLLLLGLVSMGGSIAIPNKAMWLFGIACVVVSAVLSYYLLQKSRTRADFAENRADVAENRANVAEADNQVARAQVRVDDAQVQVDATQKEINDTIEKEQDELV
jgi:uncharacterized protein YlxW (UPF0749 family)